LNVIVNLDADEFGSNFTTETPRWKAGQARARRKKRLEA
jgi:hypothetical protein